LKSFIGGIELITKKRTEINKDLFEKKLKELKDIGIKKYPDSKLFDDMTITNPLYTALENAVKFFCAKKSIN